MKPTKIDVVTLLALDPDGCRVVAAQHDPRKFYLPLSDFPSRRFSAIVLELSDGTEIGIASESDGWRVFYHQVGDPSIADQLRPSAAKDDSHIVRGEN